MIRAPYIYKDDKYFILTFISRRVVEISLSRASSGTERGGSACAGSKAKSPPPGGNRGTSRPHLALRGTTWHKIDPYM